MSRGVIALLVGVVGTVAYLGLAATLADRVVPMHWAIGLAYYLVAGLAWTWPAARLMRWGLRAG